MFGNAKSEKPRQALFGSPGFGFVQPLSLRSGRPIGEPRSNNRYYDYEANYDAVKKPDHTRADLLTEGQWIERGLKMTIGHEFNIREKVAL